MKKLLPALSVLLIVCYLFTPSCKLLGMFLGYEFTLYDPSVFITATAALSLVITAVIFFYKASFTKVGAVFSAFVLPLSILNGLFFFAGAQAPAIISVLVCVGCAAALFIKFAAPKPLKIVMGVMVAFLIVLVMLALLIKNTFGLLIGTETVVNTVYSPQTTYVAEVIVSDQGALGGATRVEIKDISKNVSVFVGEFSKPSQQVYSGEYGEYETVQIRWQGEHTLVVNGKEIDIKSAAE